MTLAAGLHPGVPMQEYQALDAMGSTRLGWLSISPLHYRYRLEHPEAETEATARGTAVHMATLQPFLFDESYACEPDPDQFGGAKPRATKAYKEAVESIAAQGRTVLRTDAMEQVCEMAIAVRRHPEAMRVLRRAAESEITAIWERNGRMCRGRIDAIGAGAAVDLKTTRSLRDFSPWELTRYGYHRQLGFYDEGLERLGHPVKHWFLIAVESSPPYDVGVFTLGPDELTFGRLECEQLLERLAECEATDEWPGMFPRLEAARITDRRVGELAEAVDG